MVIHYLDTMEDKKIEYLAKVGLILILIHQVILNGISMLLEEIVIKIILYLETVIEHISIYQHQMQKDYLAYT